MIWLTRATKGACMMKWTWICLECGAMGHSRVSDDYVVTERYVPSAFCPACKEKNKEVAETKNEERSAELVSA